MSRRRRHLLLAAVAALCVGVWLAARRDDTDAVVFERDVIYARAQDADLHLNVAVPKAGDAPLPAVVFLHGEGWRAGDRADMDHLVKGIARLGYVGVTVQYRLVPAARYPAPVEDCQAALRWLRAHADRYRIDPRRIGVVGFSAGGYLAAMLGVAGAPEPADAHIEGHQRSGPVQAVVSFFGPTDFAAREWPSALETEVIVPFLGGTFEEMPDVYRNASPITLVTPEAAPFLFLHGVDDVLVPVGQSRRLAARLEEAGVPARVVAFEHEGHGFTDATNPIAMQQMLDFLRERLGR